MKRLELLLLTAALAMALTACGGTDTTDAPAEEGPDPAEVTADVTDDAGEPADTEAEPDDAEADGEPEAAGTALVVGETVSTGLYDITVTGFEYTEDADSPDEDYGFAPRDGYVTANLYYTLKYNGKSEMNGAMLAPVVLRYGDGYTFLPEQFWFYAPDLEGWLNSGTVLPLSPEFPCKACFFVPQEVETEKGNPLSIELHAGDEVLMYSPRPEDEAAREATYEYAAALTDSDVWSDASMGRSLLAELNGYGDSDRVILDSRMRFFTYDDRQYFTAYATEQLTPLDAAAAQTLLTDATFTVRNNYMGGDDGGNHAVTFRADGTMDASYTSEGETYAMYESWRMENGQVICTHNAVDTAFTPYQFDETHYLLVEPSGDRTMLLTVPA